MRVSVIVLVLLVSGQIFGQTLLGEYTRETASLNNIYFKKLKTTGQLDVNGVKTGFWIEYKLSFDTANSSTPVTIQGNDFSLNMEFQKPSTLEKIEGAYASGQMTGQWKWFEATYYGDSLTWEVTRESVYAMGMKNGIERQYSSGGLFREARYSDNEIIGTEILYYPPGVVYAKAQWKDGAAKNSTWYYQDGKVKTTKDYKQYPLTKVTDYHENGKVKAKYTVLGDEEIIDGEYLTFDTKGKLIQKSSFDKGTEVKK